MNDSVQKIKERLSVLDVVSPYVELHKAGKNYKGKSPFTSEKTPSFYVSPDRGMYYCFSSNQGGDIFTFIEKMEGVDFKGALKILAEKAGIELVPENPERRGERETEYALIEEATKFFFAEGMNNQNAQEYILGRGVDGKTIHTWRIGFAPDAWRSLKEHLLEKKFTEVQMLRAGLIKKTDEGKESYDVFRNRIMFPIADSSGRIVAFSGRTLAKDVETPKYVNSPETEFYQKSEILFGYDKAKQGIRKFDFSLIVEGQFDLVLAHQAGYTNTVAVSGTALTSHHVSLLQRLSNRTVLALDSDRAGIAAVKRAATIMLPHGMDIKVVRIIGGKDPADIIKEDPKEFRKMVGEALHVIEFLLTVLKDGAKDERTYKLQVREELVPLLTKMPNHIDREHFEGVVAEAINTTKEAIHYEVERMSEHEREGAQLPKKSADITPIQTLTDDTPIFFASILSILALEKDREEIFTWFRKGLESLAKDVGVTVDTCLEDDPDVINEYIFKHRLDDWLSNASEKDVREKLAESLSFYHKHKLTDLKQTLDQQLVTLDEQDSSTGEILTKISEIIKKREAVHYTGE